MIPLDGLDFLNLEPAEIQDPVVRQLLPQGEPVVGEDSLAGKAYADIGRRLLGEEIPVDDYSKPEGFFEKISSLFHRS